MNDFGEWLGCRLQEQGWSIRYFAEQVGRAHTTVSRVISGEHKVTFDFCAAIAPVLDKSEVELFRMAGLIDESKYQAAEKRIDYLLRSGQGDIALTELWELAKALPPDRLEEVVRYMRFLNEGTTSK